MDSEQPNAIFLTFDDGLALCARACLNSIARNYPNHPQLCVFYDGVSAECLDFLSSFANLRIVSNDEMLPLPADMPLGEVGHIGVYRKFFVWSSFFDLYGKVLYLDIDTLVLKPIDELFAKDDFVAVSNFEPLESVRIFDPAHWGNRELLAKLEEDGLSLPSAPNDMCNAGVLMVPARYRTSSNLATLFALTSRYQAYIKYADQSVISLWCRMNDIEFLKFFEFNFQAYFFGSDLAVDYSLDTIKILHFTSSKKPYTLPFIMWPAIPKSIRWELARLFLFYAETAN